VADDIYSNLYELVTSISPEVPVYVVDLHMNESGYAGLQAFAKGFIKEGVGAGGLSIAASLKSKGSINSAILLNAIEQQYQLTIDT
jgi:NaMN:DMB phosphoribosyltransferase